MKHSAIHISDSYAIPASERVSLAKAGVVYGSAKVSPDSLGGYFDFSDWKGQPVTRASFVGRWTLLYFGYSRCQGSCRTAAPLIAKAAEELRRRGLAAKAMFVDIEATAMSLPRMVTDADAAHPHGSNWPKRNAMAQLVLDHEGKLNVVSGNRAQLARATAAFHVLREHTPPRTGEDSISINHSSMIYLVGPDTLVAGYGYHDMASATIVSLVEQLSRADRNPIDYGAIERRYVTGLCGGEA